jgi:hypothetical protein
MLAVHALELRLDLGLGLVPLPTPGFFARPLLAELLPNFLLFRRLALGNAVALRLSLRLAVVEEAKYTA